jgi:RHS repeat-associated protein
VPFGGGCGITCSNSDYIYLGGALAVVYTNSTTYFAITDQLGSTRLMTGYPSPTIAECDDYYPFGERISCGANGVTPFEFAGYLRDSETNLDDANARYFASALGRFMSPDPSGLSLQNPADPQTLNLYSYVRNNPLTETDPTGLDGTDGGGDNGACELTVINPCAPPLDFSGAGFADQGVGYTMDGISVPASVAQGAMGADSAAQCPNNTCSGFGTNASGQTAWAQFYAFAGGVSGYYNPSDLTNGVNEVNGQLYNDAGFAQFVQYGQELQQWNLAQKIASATGQNPVYVYDNELKLSPEGTIGGNTNFLYTPGLSSLMPGCMGGGEGPSCRLGGFPAIHWNGTVGGYDNVHLDTANPFAFFPFGGLTHLLIDFGLGSLNSSVPLATPGP